MMGFSCCWFQRRHRLGNILTCSCQLIILLLLLLLLLFLLLHQITQSNTTLLLAKLNNLSHSLSSYDDGLNHILSIGEPEVVVK